MFHLVWSSFVEVSPWCIQSMANNISCSQAKTRFSFCSLQSNFPLSMHSLHMICWNLKCFNVSMFYFLGSDLLSVFMCSKCFFLLKVTPMATTHSNCFRPSSFSPKKTAPNKAETTMPPPRFTAETSTGLIKETALHGNSFRDVSVYIFLHLLDQSKSSQDLTLVVGSFYFKFKAFIYFLEQFLFLIAKGTWYMESIYAASTTHTNSNNAKVRGSQSPSFSPGASNFRVRVKDGMKHRAAMTRRQYAKRHKLLDTSTPRPPPKKKGELVWKGKT